MQSEQGNTIDKMFEKLVADKHPVGEIIGIDTFMIKIRGMQPSNVHALVRFEDGSRGYIHHIYEDHVIVMKLDTTVLRVGMLAVIQHEDLLTKVGQNFVGRVINIFGDPIDGKGPIQADDAWEVFYNAPMLYERRLLDSQLETGITVLDISFSLVRGQRMAVLGDGKVGKTAMTTQIAINQKSTDITVIYVLIAKRQRDVAQLVERLEKNGAMDKAIVIVTNLFESLVTTYLAPYVGAAHGEYFWHKLGKDTLVIYDDLTSHAQAYREISLIAGVTPGRDSYPGDMFYTHSSLVERAGRLDRNGATQTILPIVYAAAGDITAYLPTNVMSMTDGQWILDMATFKDKFRPAVNTGLSVTRVGGVGQNKRQKALAAALGKTLAGYRQAEEYAHFGAELSPEAQSDFDKGKALFVLMNQEIGEGYSLVDQQFLLDMILNSKTGESIDIKKMKQLVRGYSDKLVEDKEHSNFDELRDQLKAQVLMISPTAAAAAPGTAAPAGTPAAPAGKETAATGAAGGDAAKPGSAAVGSSSATKPGEAVTPTKTDQPAETDKQETPAPAVAPADKDAKGTDKDTVAVKDSPTKEADKDTDKTAEAKAKTAVENEKKL